jgi:hypothetical protein
VNVERSGCMDGSSEQAGGNQSNIKRLATAEFVKAFLNDERGVRSALTAYLSLAGTCPYPRSSLHNLSVLSAMKLTMDAYLTETAPTAAHEDQHQQQQRSLGTRSQLFPVLVTAACVLGILDVEAGSDCMVATRHGGERTDEESASFVVLGTGHFSSHALSAAATDDDDDDDHQVDPPLCIRNSINNCAIDLVTGAVTALCDINAGDVCTYQLRKL